MAPSIAVVLACHFANRDTLCKTTIARLEAARRYLATPLQMKGRTVIVLTGDVPYETGGPMLCELMRDYFIRRGFAGTIIMAIGATGSFDEPRLVADRIAVQFPGVREFTVVSSSWHLQAAKPFWKQTARQRQLHIQFLPVRGTGGWRTKLFYAAYALLIRLSRWSGVWPKIERFLRRTAYAKRYAGFQTDGCR